MTVGVLWEFFEYSAICGMGWDMQKDTIVNTIHSVALDTTRSDQGRHRRSGEHGGHPTARTWAWAAIWISGSSTR